MELKHINLLYAMGLLLVLTRGCTCGKLLKIEKNFCKDLRDCQVYFPCSYFITGFSTTSLIKQCQNDYVFDEDKQDCVPPLTKEDFECLLITKPLPSFDDEEEEFSNKNTKIETVSKKISKMTKQSTLSNEFITDFERNFDTKIPLASTTKSKAKKKNHEKGSINNELEDEDMIDEELSESIKNLDNIINKNSKSVVVEGRKEYKKLESNKKRYSSLVDDTMGKSKIRAKKKSKSSEDEQLETEVPKREEEETEDYEDTKNVGDPNEPEYKRMCTVTDWSQFRTGKGRFQFEFINLNLCNHIIFSSVVIAEDEEAEDEEYTLKTVQHNDLDLFIKLQMFKSRNPKLKTILKIGDDNGRLYSKLSKRADTRSIFIENTIDFIETHKFDGIEIDWKWPTGPSGSPNDKQNFATLLKDFRSKMGTKYILGITVSPLTDRIQNSYMLLDINANCDYVNIEAYDYYGPWDKRTGINAPLYKMDEQFLTEAFMNIEGTVTYLKALGLSPAKMVLGIAAYGRTYILAAPAANNINAPTTGNGFSGSFTKINGLLSYYEVCECQKKGTWKEQWQPLAMSPYMYNSDNEWVSFENEESLAKKVEFVKTNGMAGIAVNSIDMDDFQGSFCNQGPYPFLRHTLGLLLNDSKLTKTIANPTTTTTAATTTLEATSSPVGRMLTKNTPLKSASRINRKSEVTTMSPDLLNSKKAAINKIINAKLPTLKPQALSPPQGVPKNRVPNQANNQAPTAEFFLITPPSKLNQNNKMDPNDYHEKLIKQELRNQEQIRIQQELEQKYHQPVAHKIVNNPPRPNPLPPPPIPPQSIPIQPQTIQKLPQSYDQPQKLSQQGPILITPNQGQAQKPIQEWHRELQQVNTQQQRQNQQQPINNQLFQQQEYQQRQRQQQEEYEHQRITNQQLELQQQQLKKLIQEQEWQLQQKNHQQAEQWIKDLQFHQQKQNEQIHLQQQLQQQLLLQQQQQQHQQQQQQPNNFNYQPAPPPPPPPPPVQPQYIPPQTRAPAPPLLPPPIQAQSVPQPQNTWSQQPSLNSGGDNRCFNKRNGIYRDEMSCSAFYVCEIPKASNGEAPSGTRIHKFTCPQGLQFNMRDCTCDWPREDSPCIIPLAQSFCKDTGPDENQKKLSPVNIQPTYQAPAPAWYPPFSCVNKEEGIHRDPSDCTKFYYCQVLQQSGSPNNLIVKHDFSCPSGLHFNLYNCQCDWPISNGCNALNGYSTYCVSSK